MTKLRFTGKVTNDIPGHGIVNPGDIVEVPEEKVKDYLTGRWELVTVDPVPPITTKEMI